MALNKIILLLLVLWFGGLILYGLFVNGLGTEGMATPPYGIPPNIPVTTVRYSMPEPNPSSDMLPKVYR